MSVSTVSNVGWGRVGYSVAVGVVTVVTLAALADQTVAAATRYPPVWLMTALAAAAAWAAFVETATPKRMPMVICPTICFTFAILLCWGPGPAIVAQLLAFALVLWRLRGPLRNAAEAWGQYLLAFLAAAVVLGIGQPDPFEHDGPTNLATDAIATLGAVVAWLAVYSAMELVHAKLRGLRLPPREVGRMVGNHALFKAALLMLAPVLAIAAHLNVGFVPLVFLPLYAVQRMARLSAERDRASRADPLTGLANRIGLRDGFDRLADARRAEPAVSGAPTGLVLFMLDLDRFKDVNDALGHDVGDRVLVAAAGRISTVVPPGAVVARLGGDEFAVLVEVRDTIEVDTIAGAIVESLTDPVRLEGLRIDVAASAGIAHHRTGEDFGTLLRHADVAMYEAKKLGSSVTTYAAHRDRNTPHQLHLLTDLRDAMVNPRSGEITMHYQPQVSLATGAVEGVEALLRWWHPRHGAVPTADLLNVAEYSPVMQQLTARVVDDVVAQVAKWRDAGNTALRASLNVSVRDLYSGCFANHLARRLAEYRVPPEQIQVEITESAVLADPGRVQHTVNQIAALGVTISLDDFGTGYSSLQHLRRLPISEIKIDRSFVAGMVHNPEDATIVHAIIEMAQLLGIRTVAEGVEDEETRLALAGAGCTLIQGWLAAYPMPADELATWLGRESPAADPARYRPAPQLEQAGHGS